MAKYFFDLFLLHTSHSRASLLLITDQSLHMHCHNAGWIDIQRQTCHFGVAVPSGQPYKVRSSSSYQSTTVGRKNARWLLDKVHCYVQDGVLESMSEYLNGRI